jgi:branched-chain amino acid transport system substrate-binding protein
VIQIWAEAAKKAGTTDPKKVATTLKASGPWQSVLGPVSFDKKGDITSGAYVMYIWDAKGNYEQM